MNQKIKELMERMVIKMLDEDLNNSESIISSQDGKTIVSIKNNSMVSLLLYLQLTSGDNGTSHKEDDDLENLEMAEAFIREPEEMTDDFNDEEKEKVLEKITSLQQKNMQFQQEMAELVNEQFG